MRCAVIAIQLLLLLASARAATDEASDAAIDAPATPDTRTPVILDHDGGIDDFITLALLLSQSDRIQLLGITILDGDCHIETAANTTLKLLEHLDHPEVPVALSTLKAVHEFPAHFRAQGKMIDVMPFLNNHSPESLQKLREGQLIDNVAGQDYLIELLEQAEAPVTIIATGPLSNLAYALEKNPELAQNISRVWWMGGALRVAGNVQNQAGSDGSAEWNSYWDPAAIGVVLNSSVPLTLVPLDGTDKVPITPDLVYAFGPQAFELYSNAVASMWAPVVTWFERNQLNPYYAWDTLTAACFLAEPELKLCTVESDLEVAAVLTGSAQGSTVLMKGGKELPVTRKLQQAAEDAKEDQSKSCKVGEEGKCHAPELAEAAAGGRELSVTKKVSAVVDVDAQAFTAFLLKALNQ